MPYSKFNNDLEFNEDKWVVTLINTKKGLEGVLGGHAKIVVEGVKKNRTSSNSDMYANELFIGEYHIMERGEMLADDGWTSKIPQFLRNTKTNFIVAFLETNEYSREDEKYKETSARSCGDLNPNDVMKMIQNIKKEQQNLNAGLSEGNFQYAGKWCFYSYEGGHNCTTWAEEKLDIIGIGKHFVTDSTKAAPFVHTNSASNTICRIL